MMEESSFFGHPVEDDEEPYLLQNSKNNSSDQHQPQQQQHSNRDSGISSGQKHQGSDQMDQFLSDTMETQNSRDSSSSAKHQQPSYSEKNAFDIKCENEPVLYQQSNAFVQLADTWKLPKPRPQQRTKPIISSIPSSGLQEGARAEVQPSRLAGRLTPPTMEILRDDVGTRHEYRPITIHYDNARTRHEYHPSDHYDKGRATRHEYRPVNHYDDRRTKSDYYSRKPSRYDHERIGHAHYPKKHYGGARSVIDYCPKKHYCSERIVYVHDAKHSIQDDDERILENLRLLRQDVIKSKCVVKKLRQDGERAKMFSI